MSGIFGLEQLVSEVYRGYKDSSGEFQALTKDIDDFTTILLQAWETSRLVDLSAQQKEVLERLTSGSRKFLIELNIFRERYSSLESYSPRRYDNWPLPDGQLEKFRRRIYEQTLTWTAYHSMLARTSVLETYHAVIKLNSLLQEQSKKCREEASYPSDPPALKKPESDIDWVQIAKSLKDSAVPHEVIEILRSVYRQSSNDDKAAFLNASRLQSSKRAGLDTLRETPIAWSGEKSISADVKRARSSRRAESVPSKNMNNISSSSGTVVSERRASMVTSEKVTLQPGYSAAVAFNRYSDPLQAVKDELLRGISNQPEPCKVEFHLAWEIEQYLDQEIIRSRVGEADRQVLSSLLVLSGDVHHCFANSCQMYMQWKWPQTFKVLLDALRFDSWGKTFVSPSGSGAVTFSYGSDLAQGVVRLSAVGAKGFLVDVAQQVSWLTASMRLPRYGQVCYSDALFVSTDVGVYKATPLPLQPVEGTKDACWLPLFLGTVIARNYPIPERQQEKGLELPFDLMTAVAGNMLPKYYDGGVYLKGYSRLLLPVSSPISGSFQWHLITSSSRQVTLPLDVIHKQTWLRIPDLRLLSDAYRTFLGYCREVIVNLGTSNSAGYYRNISFSNAHDEVQGPSIQAPTSLTWGSSGMGIFGATLNHSIVYGKALAHTITGDNDDYLDVLDLAMNTPIILYDDDNESGRGWMVPTLSVILHMIHTWVAQTDCVRSQLPYVETTWKAGDAARTFLVQNWASILRHSLNEEMSNKVVKDLVMHFWHGIQKRAEENIITRCQSTPRVELATPKLYGWDYMDLVKGKNSRRKQLRFHGNWIDLTEDVIVLFGQKFGEVIKPAPGITVCSQWNPIPPNKMYLTATVQCLQQLSWERGGQRGNLVSPRLTNKSYWNYRADRLFNDCQDCYGSSTAPNRCSKTPQKLDSSASEFDQVQLLPPSEGAVVFGCQSETARKRVPVVFKTRSSIQSCRTQ